MGITETAGSPPAPDEPFVTVQVTSTLEGWEALLAKEGLVQESFTPLGVVWSVLMQSVRDALNKG